MVRPPAGDADMPVVFLRLDSTVIFLLLLLIDTSRDSIVVPAPQPKIYTPTISVDSRL